MALLCTTPTWSQTSQTHPFLLVTEANYPALRARAMAPPWSIWKTAAITEMNTLRYVRTDPPWPRTKTLAALTGSGALAYILDPPNRPSYVRIVVDALAQWDNLFPDLIALGHTFGSEWSINVAFLSSVLALDIVYNDLSPQQRTDSENRLNRVAEWVNPNQSGLWFRSMGAAVHGIWSLYRGNRVGIDAAKRIYRDATFALLTPDGVCSFGPAYSAGDQFGWTSAQSHFMDILEFTGEDKTYYNNPQLKNHFEWYYGYRDTPFRREWVFADYAHGGTSCGDGSALYRAYRFSPEAAQYASWAKNGGPVLSEPYHLVAYLLMEQALPEAKKPPSRIFKEGGAVFNEDSLSSAALGGALWNMTHHNAHAHNDTNALSLAAYGEHVLRNSGYAGYGNGDLGFPWSYIMYAAWASNTVSVNLKADWTGNHQQSFGAGVEEGLTSRWFDYARGDSGNALPNGKHMRNFFFVHPQDGRVGYWFVDDEVTASVAGQPAVVSLHPNSNSYTVVADKLEYRWRIGPTRLSANLVDMSIFLATPPDSVTIKDGLLANPPVGNPESFVGKYLESRYLTDQSTGRKSILTVLFPHDATHPKAMMSRISGAGYVGASLDLGSGVTDVMVETLSASGASVGSISLRGQGAWYRLSSGALSAYFVRRGRSFDEPGGRGFEASQDISIHLREEIGAAFVAAPGGADVTVRSPGIGSVRVDGVSPTPLQSGEGWVRVHVAQGGHSLILLEAGPDGGAADGGGPELDAGWRDGGVEEGLDGGATAGWVDGGESDGGEDIASIPRCGCSGGPTSAVLFLVLLAWGAALRPWRRASTR